MEFSKTKPTRVGRWIITYWAKPIPDRRWDWEAVHDDYDGENSDLCFCAESPEAIMDEIEARADD